MTAPVVAGSATVGAVALVVAAAEIGPPTDWNPLVAAGAILLTAIAVAIPGVLAYASAKRAEEKITEAAKVAEATLAQSKEIHDAVNGHSKVAKDEANAVKAELKIANARIEALALLVSEMKIATARAEIPPAPKLEDGGTAWLKPN